MPESPLTLSSTRHLLETLGLRPHKRMGQNFLVDGNIVRKSLELAEIAPGDMVVEIGPGLGTLTGALLAAGAKVHAVEMDHGLHRHLEATLATEFPERFHLLRGDALDLPLAGLDPAAAEGGFKIVANLPYSISTPWMETVLRGPLPDRMVLMLQKETADRFAAEPGGKQFGAITVFLRSAFAVAKGHKVSRSCFYPVPDVDSFLFHLERLPDPFRFEAGARAFARGCFTQRRKQLGHLVKVSPSGERGERWLARLADHGRPPSSRPAEIEPELWQLF